ncbi:MAG: hypothetical protein WCW02_01565 [Candidatus Buchananbacteria bacterium]
MDQKTQKVWWADIDMPRCQHLKLKPEGPENLASLLSEAKDNENTEIEKEEWLDQLIGTNNLFTCRTFTAWCTKNDCCCVVTEKPIKNNVTPLVLLINKRHLITDCGDREWTAAGSSRQFLKNWLLEKIEPDLKIY